MKFLGAIVIWSCITCAGFSVSSRLVRRKSLFDGLVLLVDNIYNDIRYFSRPISESILSNSMYLDNRLVDKLVRKTDEGEDFPLAWESVIAGSDLPLSNAEKDKIISMVLNLGKSDSEIQLNILNSYKAYFLKMAEAAETRKNKYSAPISVSSALLGAAVLLVLI